MRIPLLFPDQTHNYDQDTNQDSLLTDTLSDLRFPALFDVAANGDDNVRRAFSHVVASPSPGTETIQWRQAILKDAMKQPELILNLYSLATKAIQDEKKNRWYLFADDASSLIHRSVIIMQLFRTQLIRLRGYMNGLAADNISPGLASLKQSVEQCVTDAWLADLDDGLKLLTFPDGVETIVRLGKRALPIPTTPIGGSVNQMLLKRLTMRMKEGKPYVLNDNDARGAEELSDFTNRALSGTAALMNALYEAVLSCFHQLRDQTAFYLGCINLQKALQQRSMPTCLPEISKKEGWVGTNLYDPILSLTSDSRVVGSSVNASNSKLVIITGANQGGKTTFLRSLGIALFLADCGAPVPASSFVCKPHRRIFTHFEREEDSTMKHGKLDEELERASHIIDAVHPGDAILFNESFSSTNEREGSEIAEQIIDGLEYSGIPTIFVTHLSSLAEHYLRYERNGTLFLSPQLDRQRRRTFCISEQPPQTRAFAKDIYVHEMTSPHIQNLKLEKP